MTLAHRRKKNPDQVRLNIIESAINLALGQGLPAISLETVAAAAGITKGGLFHHFPNKQVLIEQVYEHLLVEFTATIETSMARDPDGYGRFTRAYIDLALADDPADPGWAALWASTITDKHLSRVWGQWLAGHLARHREADDPRLQAARYAADGVWAAVLCETPPSDTEALHRYLIGMTRRREDD